jgi:hypothetical protein
MDIFLHDPHEIPLPPDEVRLRALHAEPWPDGRRVRVSIELDPFHKRPSLTLAITDASGRRLAGTSIIESMTRKIELNLHLPSSPPPILAPCTLAAELFYLPPLPPAGEAIDPDAVAQPIVVDRRSIQFDI